MSRRPGVAAGRVLVLVAAIASAGTLLSAHELFLRPRGFFVAPGATITLPVFNGTFAASENAIAARRITDLSRLGPDGRVANRAGDVDGTRPAQHVRSPSASRAPTHRRGARRPSDRARLAGLRSLSRAERITPILDRRRSTKRLGTRVRESYARRRKR